LEEDKEMKDIFQSKMKLAGLILAFLILVVLPPLITSYWVTLLTQMLIFGVLAMSLDILLGYTGMPSFGHAGFFGASAYAIAILSTRYQVGFWPSSLIGIVLATGIGAIFGLIVAHSKGVYFLMITLALGMVLWGLAFRWVSMTGGDNGIAGIPRPEIGLPINMDDPITFYYATLVFFTACLVLMGIFIRSPFGQSLRGVRESESRMRILGYNTWLHRYLSYVIAAAFGGTAGIFWAYYNGFVSPHDLELTASFELFLMVILGGPGTLVGPALGAGIIVFLRNFISAYTQRWLLILGAVYILTILYAPQGFVNLMKDLARKREKKGELEDVR
jgi:branched-chain amino acid transport system permease protein